MTCSSGNVDLTQLRQPSEELLGFWQTHKFKARQGQTFIYYYNIFTDILKIFVKKLIMKCAFIWHLSLFWLNKCWWFSLLRSWHFFYMVSIEIPLPEPRIKMRGGKIIPYILCELVSIIWMLPAFEFHCWMRLLLCQCSSISREMAVPIGSLSCRGWRGEPSLWPPSQCWAQGQPALPTLCHHSWSTNKVQAGGRTADMEVKDSGSVRVTTTMFCGHRRMFLMYLRLSFPTYKTRNIPGAYSEQLQ